MRFKQNLYCSGHIFRDARLYRREQPTFILHGNRNREVRTQRIIAADPDIGEGAAARDKLPAHLLVPEIELQAVASTEPIIGPSLRALAAATHPITDYISIVRVTVEP